ncbi:hypothetical protein [Natronobacterium gregoryi]|uniref:Uncharacterized protein n=2 Tax=Natronobacterium gregoryi TaxID=44930 RepID=L0AGX4_NATGS|nr:hypothetical protein [Natronobacterium gregoryi]AFZ73128.1 hypothetical protein Natgr_1945 [Natronobacterium gregoryi SP2]SFI60627.1 hypothetical protein SAMN05443661_102137 [Natronobacterium gregoryi]
MRVDELRGRSNRGIESVHAATLLFGFTIVLSLFMAGVIFLNGTGH